MCQTVIKWLTMENGGKIFLYFELNILIKFCLSNPIEDELFGCLVIQIGEPNIVGRLVER